MSGPTAFTREKVYIQLVCIENGIEYNEWRFSLDYPPDQYLKWKRHYFLKRLLALQLRDFNRE